MLCNHKDLNSVLRTLENQQWRQVLNTGAGEGETGSPRLLTGQPSLLGELQVGGRLWDLGCGVDGRAGTQKPWISSSVPHKLGMMMYNIIPALVG